jgi:serine protease Do
LSPLWGQQSLETAYRTTGNEVMAAFEAQRAVLQTSSAVILEGRRDEAVYGIVISPDGHVLTKASEFQHVKKPSVMIDRKNYKEVRLLAVDPAWDVALLKVDAESLTPVVYASASNVPQGTWVVTNGATSRTRRRAVAGIVSANIREIPASGGAVLGVTLDVKAKELEITEVHGGSGAEEAGLRKGDALLTIAGKPVTEIEEVAEALKEYRAGSLVKITYRRNGNELAADVRLSTRGELFDELKTRNDVMSGEVSKRRSGFPRILQHDILGSRWSVGGPLLDLDGRCVGMNIARATRSESYAIPVEALKEIAERLVKQAAANSPAEATSEVKSE